MGRCTHRGPRSKAGLNRKTTKWYDGGGLERAQKFLSANTSKFFNVA